MLKIYKVGEFTFQFEEGEQPSSAVEVEPEKTDEPKTPRKAKTKKQPEPMNK